MTDKIRIRQALVLFSLDGASYALDLDAVERVLHAVAARPLPGAPEIVLGAFNLHGDVIPVVDVRRRLGLQRRDLAPTARLLVARAGRRRVAVPVDDVGGVVEVDPGSVTRPAAVVPGLRHVKGVVALAGGLLLIQDLDAFLSLDEEARLAAALERARS
jgi:purine-binding chemotaxis protein CheW